jgi:hypothetical protein
LGEHDRKRFNQRKRSIDSSAGRFHGTPQSKRSHSTDLYSGSFTFVTYIRKPINEVMDNLSNRKILLFLGGFCWSLHTGSLYICFMKNRIRLMLSFTLIVIRDGLAQSECYFVKFVLGATPK